MAAISKIVKSPYLSEKSSDFDEIRYTTANVELDSVHVTKNWIFLKFKMKAAAILKIDRLSDFSEILYEEA